MHYLKSRLTPEAQEYGSCLACRVSFLIYPGEISPEQVTEHLSVVPTKWQIKGQNVTLPSGKISNAKLSFWFLESEAHVESKDLRDHINWLVEILRASRNGLKTLQSIDGIKMTVKCVWESAYGDSGPVLWPEQMRALAELNLECGFDFYYYGQDNEGQKNR